LAIVGVNILFALYGMRLTYKSIREYFRLQSDVSSRLKKAEAEADAARGHCCGLFDGCGSCCMTAEQVAVIEEQEQKMHKTAAIEFLFNADGQDDAKESANMRAPASIEQNAQPQEQYLPPVLSQHEQQQGDSQHHNDNHHEYPDQNYNPDEQQYQDNHQNYDDYHDQYRNYYQDEPAANGEDHRAEGQIEMSNV
jgi:hypothetical protein